MMYGPGLYNYFALFTRPKDLNNSLTGQGLDLPNDWHYSGGLRQILFLGSSLIGMAPGA